MPDVRVVHTAAELYNQASGPSHSIPNLVYWLHQLGLKAELQALMPAPETQLPFPQTYHPKSRFIRRLGISPQMRRTLARLGPETDVIHTHNLWMMPNMYPHRVAKRHGCRLVVSPRGTLTPWSFAYNRGRKRIIWSLAQRRVVFEADCIHATSADEIAGLRALGVTTPIALIPNGVNVPELLPRQARSNDRTLLFLGRIHPKKGLDKLIRAWKRLGALHPNWSLEIVGPDNIGHRGEMERLAVDLELERFRFSAPVHGVEKDRKYQAADLFVLPTYSENFGIAVAEALANAVPAVVTKGAPWGGLVEHECGLWIDDGIESLVSALDRMMSLTDAERASMGSNGRLWMEKDFSWPSVATMMQGVYMWLLGRADRPAYVLDSG